MNPSISSRRFGTLPDGREVQLFSINLEGRLELSVMDLGATWTHLFAPDKNGEMSDLILGFDSLEGFLHPDYRENYCYMGSTIGRVAGRIRNNAFQLDGQTIHLPPNNLEGVHLHGGPEGWDRKLWQAEPFETADTAGVTFYYQSPDGEGKYPGTIDIWVTYRLDASGRIEIQYKALSDRKTILNPTNHAYFNLSGNHQNPIEDHLFWVDADQYLSIDAQSLPTGDMLSVENTPFDFRTAKSLKEALSQDCLQLQLAGGIDHTFVLNQAENCAVLFHPESGRKLTLSTTELGLQVYTSNYLDNKFKGKGGIAYGKRAGICLETQHFPDSCNHPNFPSILLMLGEIFESKTQFVFTAG